MSDESRFELVPRASSTGALIIFAPSRTTITAFHVESPETQITGVSLRNLAIGLSWHPSSGEADGLLRLSVQSSGEELRPFGASWRTAETVLDFGEASDQEERVNRWIYDARHGWAESDREHAFMFEIDRQTNKQFMRYADLPGHVVDARIERADCLVDRFETRLEDHHYRVRYPDLEIPPTPVDPESVRQFSEIVWAAASRLGADDEDRLAQVAHTLERFAAGQLRRTVEGAPPGIDREFLTQAPKDVIEADVNSYFVYMFAELAFAAIELGFDAERWRAVLPSLLLMQACFNERCSTRIGPSRKVVHHSRTPRGTVDKCRLDELRASCPRPTGGGLDEFKSLVGQNLLALGPGGFS